MCIYEYTHLRAYVRTYVHAHMHIRACRNDFARLNPAFSLAAACIRMYGYTSLSTVIQLHKYTYQDLNIHTDIQIGTYTHVYTYIYICI